MFFFLSRNPSSHNRRRNDICISKKYPNFDLVFYALSKTSIRHFRADTFSYSKCDFSSVKTNENSQATIS